MIESSAAIENGSQAANTVELVGFLDPSRFYTYLILADGQTVRTLTSNLVPREPAEPAFGATAAAGDGTIIVPVIEETLVVGKRPVVTDRVVLTKTVEEEEKVIELPILTRTFSIERFPMNYVVDTPPAVRQDGATTTYALVEERFVKQLVVVEEIRITEHETQEMVSQVVNLRRDRISVDHTPRLR